MPDDAMLQTCPSQVFLLAFSAQELSCFRCNAAVVTLEAEEEADLRRKAGSMRRAKPACNHCVRLRPIRGVTSLSNAGFDVSGKPEIVTAGSAPGFIRFQHKRAQARGGAAACHPSGGQLQGEAFWAVRSACASSSMERRRCPDEELKRLDPDWPLQLGPGPVGRGTAPSGLSEHG